MSRPATGSACWIPKTATWGARITAPGTSRKPIPMVDADGKPTVPACLVAPSSPPRGCACSSCSLAKRIAKRMSDRARNEGRVHETTGETVSEWYGRYYAAAERGEVGRKNRGKPQASVEDRRARFRTWIEPEIGSLEMVAVQSSDLRRIVQRLDAAVRERGAFYDKGDDEHAGRKPGLSGKTAENVFSEITSGFREARRSKIEDLAILRGRPDQTADVEPPTPTEEREQAALFPSEVVALLSCEGIPLKRRYVYAVAIYTGMRRSELVRLEAEDVDLEHGVIRVRGKKTAAAKRTISIEFSLRPLLEVLVRERPKGTLLDVPVAHGRNGAADLMRKDLSRAKLDRSDLSRDDAQHMPFTFHGLRHTCITHWTVAGRDQLFLLTAAGHTDLTMTKRYLAAAASLSTKFGHPHPPLPAALHGAVDVPEEFRLGSGIPATPSASEPGKTALSGWAHRDLNPGPTD